MRATRRGSAMVSESKADLRDLLLTLTCVPATTFGAS
jgi:hypothetical protein